MSHSPEDWLQCEPACRRSRLALLTETSANDFKYDNRLCFQDAERVESNSVSVITMSLQEAQLSQRCRATLCFVGNLAVTHSHSKHLKVQC